MEGKKRQWNGDGGNQKKKNKKWFQRAQPGENPLQKMKGVLASCDGGRENNCKSELISLFTEVENFFLFSLKNPVVCR